MSRPYFEVAVRIVKDGNPLSESIQTLQWEWNEEKNEAQKIKPAAMLSMTADDILATMTRDLASEMHGLPFEGMIVECIRNLQEKLGARITQSAEVPVPTEEEQNTDETGVDPKGT